MAYCFDPDCPPVVLHLSGVTALAMDGEFECFRCEEARVWGMDDSASWNKWPFGFGGWE